MTFTASLSSSFSTSFRAAAFAASMPVPSMLPDRSSTRVTSWATFALREGAAGVSSVAMKYASPESLCVLTRSVRGASFGLYRTTSSPASAALGLPTTTRTAPGAGSVWISWVVHSTASIPRASAISTFSSESSRPMRARYSSAPSWRWSQCDVVTWTCLTSPGSIGKT